LVLAHKPTSMRTTQSLVRTSFLLAAAAFTFVEAPAASITVTTGATPIGTGGTVTTAADFITVNGGILEVTSNSTIGGLSGTGGQVSSGFQNPAYTHSILTLNVAAGESYVYNGTIRPNNYDGASVNALQITKTGLGTQELAGVLTGYITSPGQFNRPTLFASGGTLKLSGAWGFDTYVDYQSVGASVTANNGGILEISVNWTHSSGNAFNQLSDNAGNILVNNGTLRFSAVNQDATRSFTVGGGGATLSVAAGITFNNRGIIYGSTGGSLTLAGESTSATLTNAVAATGTWAVGAKLIKEGSGTWTVAGVHQNISGGVQVNQGTLVLTANSASTAATSIAAGGTLEMRSTLVGGTYAGAIANDGTFLFNSSSSQALNGLISGAGTLVKQGAGTLTLGAANTFTGDTAVTAGSLRLNHVNSLQFSKLVTNSAAGTIAFAVAGGVYNVGAISGSGTIALSDTATTPGAITLVTGHANVVESFAGVLSGLGRLEKLGTSTLTLTSINTYAGPTVVSSGTLALSGSGTLGAGAVQLNGGVLDLSSSAVAFTQSVNLNGGQLVGGSIDVAQVTSAQGGVVLTELTGTNSLAKTGATTTLVLGAGVTHTYTGATFVNAGKLQVNGTIASSSVSVANGASLGGHGTISGNVNLASGSTINAGGSVGNLTVGSLTITAGTIVGWDVYDASGAAGVGYDKFTVAGTLDLSGLSSVNKATLKLISLSDPLNNLPGNAGLFDQSLSHAFTLFTYGSLNLGSNTDITSLFTFDKTLLKDGTGNEITGDFSLQNTGSAINLVYATPVPEPSTYGLALGFLSLAAIAVRRQRRKAPMQA